MVSKALVKNGLNVFITFFLALMWYSIIVQNVGDYAFFMSMVVLLTVIKLIITLIDLKYTGHIVEVSRKVGKLLAIFLFLAGVLIFVYIFFQLWRLFFEEKLMATYFEPQYRPFIERLRVLGYSSFLLTLLSALIILKRLNKIYLVPIAALVLSFLIIAFLMGRDYFPKVPFPAPTQYEQGEPSDVYYAFSRLSGLPHVMVLVSSACVFALQKAIDIFRSPVQIKLSNVAITISYYAALILAELFGFLALAMVTIKA